jgi:phosphoserine phosphatase RsbU/P
MPINLPNSEQLRAAVDRVLRPRTKLGKTTLWFGGLAFIVELLRIITRSPAGTMLSGWSTFLSFVFASCGLILGLRWLRRQLMWRLRNRLIVTYVFIGVIPVALLVMMAIVAGYLFAGQFATYVALSDLQSELQHLEATNDSLAAQFRTLARAGRLNAQFASEIAGSSGMGENFPQRSVSVWQDEKGFVLVAGRPTPGDQPVKALAAIPGDFRGFVVDREHLHLRAVKHLYSGAHRLTVISDVPITPQLLEDAAAQLGLVSLFPPDRKSEHPATPESTKSGTVRQKPDTDIKVDFGDTNSTVSLSGTSANGRVEAGRVPPAINSFDVRIPFGTRFAAVDWETGSSHTGLLLVDTRLSMLSVALFSSLGEKSRIYLDVLAGIAIFFGLIELVALIIGIRLTRSMTRSVGELYAATQHINRGDLKYRVRIRTQDQMAALESSFNSMTESLSTLIAEQKEKQRLEGELAIAHEVQALLFPADMSGLSGLEVHGVCRPARTVSGDYYDFIPLRENKLVIALGDISGKGISAALLMATVHAFVRAYSLEPERTFSSVALGAGTAGNDSFPPFHGNGNGDSENSPARLMATLNYQLYRSTPPEKYATMFLGCYDALSRSLVYSNAGHLPPLLLCDDGRIARLEASGTVVGLFDAVRYNEDSVAMRPGDIFLAYSDGVTEPENEFGEFGEERLIELIQRHRNESLSRISDLVTGAVADWIGGGEQPDDVTLVLARAR